MGFRMLVRLSTEAKLSDFYAYPNKYWQKYDKKEMGELVRDVQIQLSQCLTKYDGMTDYVHVGLRWVCKCILVPRTTYLVLEPGHDVDYTNKPCIHH